jgi:hypothetical protein
MPRHPHAGCDGTRWQKRGPSVGQATHDGRIGFIRDRYRRQRLAPVTMMRSLRVFWFVRIRLGGANDHRRQMQGARRRLSATRRPRAKFARSIDPDRHGANVGAARARGRAVLAGSRAAVAFDVGRQPENKRTFELTDAIRVLARTRSSAPAGRAVFRPLWKPICLRGLRGAVSLWSTTKE